MSPPRKTLRLLFVADPLANFHPQRETSLVLMHEAARRGHEIFATTATQLSTQGRKVFAHTQKLKILGLGKTPWHQVIENKVRELKSFDVILLRKDPPFDQGYLHHLYLLDLISSDVYMMNHPRGILFANEKLLPLNFPELSPETLISADRSTLENFIRSQRKGVVIKPIDSSGGRGVFLLKNPQVENLHVILESATNDYTRHVVAQAFVPEVKQGDKRIMLLGQEVLGCFVRKASRGEHRANLHSGGSAHPAQLKNSDKKIVTELQETLRNLGLDFVGLDIIGKYLTEINVTSPMGLAEINATGGTTIQRKVVDFIEKKLGY